MIQWRFLDTGRLSASENMALDEVLLECRARGKSPNTVRVMQFSNPAVLVGFNQSVEQEARVNYCLEKEIDINRRITGGGAIFFDQTQIGWEVICEKSFLGAGLPNTALFESICEPVVQALRELGIQASFRPRNDIEVDGRKISGTGGTDEGGALLFQGTLLVDFDVDSMLRALRVPVEKLKAKELESAKDRVTCLKWELGHVPGPEEIKSLLKRNFESAFRIELVDGGLTREEEILFNERKMYFESPGWVHKVKSPGNEQSTIHSIHKGDGGIIRTAMNVNMQQERIKSVLITGDFFSFPQRIILNLEAELKDVKADIGIISEKVEHFFERTDCTVPGFGASDFIEGVKKCLDKAEITRYGIPLHLANRINVVNDTFAGIIGKSPRHLLLPYCSKSLSCGWRYKDGCAECGECSIGNAYTVGNAKNMDIMTIQSFEHLIETIERLKDEGALSYIGCCCDAFYAKHMEDFEISGLPAILLDIDSTTCYEMGKEENAYEGKFENQTDVNLKLLRMVLDVTI
ncbi:MAG: DUF116 domain-containing protein [Thermoplasmata archaeon]|nr:DUF116 domain-containing protein [Thermoplasmata archaeon]